MKELDLELKSKVLVLSSRNYYLRVDLPNEIDPKKGCSAKFDKSEKILRVKARIVE